MARPGLNRDTTIFSRALETVDMDEMPGGHMVPAGGTAIDRCSRFADICRRLWEWPAPQAQTRTRG